MNRYIKNLKAFLADQTPNYGYTSAQSMLEMLYYFYTEANPMENAVIRFQFKKLDNILSKLSLEDNDAVFTLTSSLCLDSNKRGFLEGIRVGMQLFTELNTLP